MSSTSSTDSAPAPALRRTRPPRSRRRFRVLRWGGLALLLLVIALELFARLGLGLGDPPLMMADDRIEYLAQPSKTYHRFGNRIAYNQWSMRSDEFPARKSDPDEYRVLVLGDSVVNGGAQTDQANIATELIKTRLASELNRPTHVGNISAGSWGPPNLLAYVQRFGLFEADAVVIVLSSHDASDVLTFEPLGIDMPQRKPLLALQEAAMRYLPRYLPSWAGGASAKAPATTDPRQATLSADQEAAARAQALAALRELIETVQSSGARLAIAQHWERSEIESNRPEPGHTAIAALAAELNVPRIDLGLTFAAALGAGENPYRDNIHPNDTGQRLIAEAIMAWLRE